MACCGQMICLGCVHQHELERNRSTSCPFCRAEIPDAGEDAIRMMKKRANSNDSNALCQLGMMYMKGDSAVSMKKDIDKAVKFLLRAAELGSAQAYHSLGVIRCHLLRR